jgi:hypothetical protein
VPGALTFALWWRGGSFVESELTAADVHLEFVLGGVILLIELVIFHGIVSIDPMILIWAAGLFAISGTIASAMARQDAADAARLGGGRALATTIALVPIAVTVGLLLVLRPDVMSAMWRGLAQLIELALTPLFLLLSWLASLLPAAVMPGEVRPPARPPLRSPDLDALAQQQTPPDWIPWLAAAIVLGVVLLVAAGILRWLLESELVVRGARDRTENTTDVSVERTGGAGQDVRQLMRWLGRWLRSRLGRQADPAGAAHDGGPAAADAWVAYRTLLDWGAQHGVRRRPSETTHQLQERLQSAVPEAADSVGLVTSTYEWERYGEVHPATDLLRRVQAALAELSGSI